MDAYSMRMGGTFMEKMDKHRINTTISTKHWEILKNHAAKYESQQKALEFALESLADKSKQNTGLSSHEQLWISTGREMKSACIVHKGIINALLKTADFEKLPELMKKLNPMEYLIIWYYGKSLMKCTLKELIDVSIFFISNGNMMDTVYYIDDDQYFTIKLIHNLNINNSRMFKILIESLFNAYGVRTESEISSKSLFMKVFKI